MHRRPVRIRLNLLLAILLMVGQWPVFAGIGIGDGCGEGMPDTGVAMTAQHCDCDHEQGTSCGAPDCAAMHGAVIYLLASRAGGMVMMAPVTNIPVHVLDSPSHTIAAPPTPPPIVIHLA